MKLSSAGLIKFNSSNTDTIYGLYTKYATKCETCALVTLSNIGVYRRIFESGLAKQYIVFDEGFIAIKLLCKQYNVKFVEINSEEIYFTEENMNIDLTIMNPPYEQNLPTKILNKCIENSKKTIYIGPINTWQKSVIAEENLDIPVSFIEYIEKNKACEIFNIAIRNDCGIVTVDNNEKDNSYKKIEHIVPFLNIKRKFYQFNNINYINFIEKEPSKYSLRMFYGCNRDESHKWTVCPTNEKAAFSKEITGHIKFFNVSNKIELKNVYDYMSSKIIKTICKLTSGSFTPVMNDYSKSWSNKKLCIYFGITGYIDDNHAEKGSEWEIILNTMKEFE